MDHIRLRTRRRYMKLKQDDVASKIGKTRQAYGHYETGRNEPDSETISKLAEILECTTDYLHGKTDNPKGVVREDGSETDVYELFMESDEPLTWNGKPLTEKQKKRLIKLLEAYLDEDE